MVDGWTLARHRCLTGMVLTLLLLAAAPAGSQAVPRAERIEVVVVAMGPYGHIDRRGKPAGLFVEILQTLTANMGLPVSIRVQSYDAAMRALRSGEADLSLYFPSPELSEQLTLLLPLAPLELGILYRDAGGDSPPLRRLGSIEGRDYGIRYDRRYYQLHPVGSYRQGLALMHAGQLSGMLGAVDGLLNSTIAAGATQRFMVYSDSCRAAWLLASRQAAQARWMKRLLARARHDAFKTVTGEIYRAHQHRWPQPC